MSDEESAAFLFCEETDERFKIEDIFNQLDTTKAVYKVEMEWYHDISSWEGLRQYLGSTNSLKLKAPKLTKKLSNKLIKEIKEQSRGLSIKKLNTIRDNFLIDLLKLKNKYNF